MKTFPNLCRLFKLRLIQFLLIPVAISACGGELNDSDSSSSSKSNPKNNEEPKVGSIKDFKFLDITDATSLGIVEKGSALPVASYDSGNLVASLDVSGDEFSSVAESPILSQERRIYKVDASGNKFILDYIAEDMNTVIDLPYEPKDIQQLGTTWIAIRFKPTQFSNEQDQEDYERYEFQKRMLDEVIFVNQTNGSVYLLEKRGKREGEIIWDFQQGAETSFYAVNHSLGQVFQIDFDHEPPTLSNPLPNSHQVYGKILYTKNDAIIYENSKDHKFYIKFVKEKKFKKMAMDGSNLDSKYGCGQIDDLKEFAISPDGNLLCKNIKSKLTGSGFADTLSVIKLNLNANALDGIASTKTVVDFDVTQFKPRGNYDDSRFIQLKDSLFQIVYFTNSPHLTIFQIYPTQEIYEFKEIWGNWRQVIDPNSWQKDGISYRQFEDELYLFTKKAYSPKVYGMWKIDLTNPSAGATKITVKSALKTLTSFEKTWFTDDKKFLVKGVDNSGTSFIGRIDLTKSPLTLERISEFKNEVIRLIQIR